MTFDPRTDIGTTFGHGLDSISALVYGAAGTGKTRLAATTGDPKRTLVLAADPGQLTLRALPIRRIQITTPERFDEVLTWLESYAAHGKRLSDRWTWVVTDSITEIGEAILAEMLARPAKSGDKGHGLAAYGDTQQLVMGFIKRLRDLPTNTVTIAEQERIQDGESGNLLFGPTLPGKKLGPKTAYKFDLVMATRCATDQGRIVYWLQTANDGRYEAKDRSGVLDAAEPPDLANIRAKILASMPAPEPTPVASEAEPAQATAGE